MPDSKRVAWRELVFRWVEEGGGIIMMRFSCVSDMLEAGGCRTHVNFEPFLSGISGDSCTVLASCYLVPLKIMKTGFPD